MGRPADDRPQVIQERAAKENLQQAAPDFGAAGVSLRSLGRRRYPQISCMLYSCGGNHADSAVFLDFFWLLRLNRYHLDLANLRGYTPNPWKLLLDVIGNLDHAKK